MTALLVREPHRLPILVCGIGQYMGGTVSSTPRCLVTETNTDMLSRYSERIVPFSLVTRTLVEAQALNGSPFENGKGDALGCRRPPQPDIRRIDL